MKNNETVGPGKFVAYSYKLYNDADGSLLFEATKDAPDTMVFGVSADIVPGLPGVIEGLKTGDRFSVTLPPAAGFGERFPDNVVELDRSIFMRDGRLAAEVKKGGVLPMIAQGGMMIRGKVLDITDSHVTMDFNHPFAGLTVRYEGEVVDVREATPEELKKAGGCGCGGGCCGGGSCGDGCGGDGCGDGCGCGGE